MTEAVIIEGIRNKDNVILSEFYKRNLPGVRKFVLNNSGNNEDVNDVLQEGIILIYQKVRDNSLKINVSLNTYLLAICKNMWLMRLRKTKKLIVNSNSLDENEGYEENIILDLIQSEKYSLYRKHFLQLEEGCRSLLDLVFGGKSMDEVAKIMKISVGYARKKKFMCKERLLQMIQNDSLFEELKSHKSVI